MALSFAFIFFSGALWSIAPVVRDINDNILALYDTDGKTSVPSAATTQNKTFPDIHYEFKIAELNKKTPLELQFNQHVKSNIERYTSHRRDFFSEVMGKSKYYFPLFEEYLTKYNIPIEFKYLSVIESGLNPLAVSSSGAVGLWQFKYHSAKLFNLEINSFIDERSDPIKSTIAACEYLTYLHRTFNDWLLVMAAFNGGPGEVRNAIQKSGGKTNYWELLPYFAAQTQDYVPRFIAAMYVINYAALHGITEKPHEYNYLDTDTIRIYNELSFEQINSITNIDIEKLNFLNPIYKINTIPETVSGQLLRLPISHFPLFIEKQNAILVAKQENKTYHTMVQGSYDTSNKTKIIHTVKNKEYMHRIALKYNCTPENIMIWNNLEDLNVSPDQKLIIWVNP